MAAQIDYNNMKSIPELLDEFDAKPVLGLLLTDKCNAQCRHCWADGSPQNNQTMGLDEVRRLIAEAAENGFKKVGLLGGEPFLYFEELLLPALEAVLKTNIDQVTLDTNGYWGKTRESAASHLSKLQEVGQSSGKDVGVVISVDQYHQEHIPLASIANIIIEFKRGNYRNLYFGISTFDDEQSLKTMLDLFKMLAQAGIIMITCQTADGIYLYPAVEGEILPLNEQFYPKIAARLGLTDGWTVESLNQALEQRQTPGGEYIFVKAEGELPVVVFMVGKQAIHVSNRVLNNMTRIGTDKRTDEKDARIIPEMLVRPNGEAHIFVNLEEHPTAQCKDRKIAEVIAELKARTLAVCG